MSRRSVRRTPIVVVGGVYRERCLRPFWDEVFGSGGRAATAIARMGAPIALHTYVDPLIKGVAEAQATLEGFSLNPTTIEHSLSFSYNHGLDSPRINGRSEMQAPIGITAEKLVRFGMLEGDAIVHAGRAVYDPQNMASPTHYRANGSTARELALVLNRSEASALARMLDASTLELATALMDQKAADVVVIKQGPLGAFVHDGRSTHTVPVYYSDRVWKIGSGDMFVAHFAYRWLHEGRSPSESAEKASRATAFYCQTQGFPSSKKFAAFSSRPITPSPRFERGYRPVVYLAGPFFTLAHLWMIEQAREGLQGMGLTVFSPYHDVGHGSADDVVSRDLAAIEAADLMFAIVDGMDSGTVYEIGYARAKGKPVVVYSENETPEDKKMMQGSGCVLCDDFVTAIYQAIWIACAS